MDEVKRLYIWNEQDVCFYFSMKQYMGWWYLRILRWFTMASLRDFLMRWFYEPFYGLLFNTAFLEGYDTSEEEDKRMLVAPQSEEKRMLLGEAEEAKRMVLTNEETKRQVIG